MYHSTLARQLPGLHCCMLLTDACCCLADARLAGACGRCPMHSHAASSLLLYSNFTCCCTAWAFSLCPPGPAAI